MSISTADSLYIFIIALQSELVATKLSNIQGGYPHIQRMEIRQEEQNEKGKWLPAKRIVVLRTKSQAVDRNVYLTDESMDLISCLKKELVEQGFHDEDYLFQNSLGRIISRAVDTRIRKYCDHINILQKSTHKVRKTYISTLIDAGININEIRKAVGHEDEKRLAKTTVIIVIPKSRHLQCLNLL